MAEDMPRPPADYEIPMSNPTREISAGNLALVQMAENVPRPPNKMWPKTYGLRMRAYNFVSLGWRRMRRVPPETNCRNI